MEKQRQSNFELLRLISIGIILTYHFMLYNGVVSFPYNCFTVPGFLAATSALPQNYVFMSVSAYFLLSSDIDYNKSLSRFKKNLVMVLVLLCLKLLIICGILGYSPEIKLYNDFFIKGSWWFIYIYLVILLLYPLLNHMIFNTSIRVLRLICIAFGIWLTVNGIINHINYFNDAISFVFTYIVIGYLKRTNFENYFGMKIQKKTMLCLIGGCFLTVFATFYLAKTSDIIWIKNNSNEIIQHLMGKYCILHFVLGVSFFVLFREIKISYNKWINTIAKKVLYVFLFHETVLALYWKFGLLRTIDGRLPFNNYLELILQCALFVGSSLCFACLVSYVYERVDRCLRKH